MVSDRDVASAFPFPQFREKQAEVMKVAAKALYEDDYDIVIIDAPTGVGKSAINVGLANMPKGATAFYTTPQKSLRQQLQDDPVLSQHYEVLRGRADYKCGVTGSNCKECRINVSSEDSCREFDECTYWNAKYAAMGARLAVLTFSFLIYDKMLPSHLENGERLSFDDRDLLIVDEAHGLEGQVASLHAGVEVSPWALPDEVYAGALSAVSGDEDLASEVRPTIDALRSECKLFSRDHAEDAPKAAEQCKHMASKLGWMLKEMDEYDRVWTIETGETRYKGQPRKTVTFSPVRVDFFLNHHIWSRAPKAILSSATIPYRGNPGQWARRLGIPSDRKVLSIPVGMPFPAKNRPIHTHTMVGSMSSGGDDRHWPEIMEALDALSEKHAGEKGLIHTASYARARRAFRSVTSNPSEYPNLARNVMLHEPGQSAEDRLTDWQASNKDVLFTPTMTEGVDLRDDMCRWQVLLKVPYPYMGDSRVKYLVQQENDWTWYNESAATSIVQSYGRAVRSKDDYADYYVLDEKFDSLKSRYPEWLTEAIIEDIADAPQYEPANALDW